MKRTRFHISAHARLSYLERVKGMDMAALDDEIGRKIAAAEESPPDLPEPNAIVVDGFRYCLSGDTVTTVTPHCEPNLRTHRGRK